MLRATSTVLLTLVILHAAACAEVVPSQVVRTKHFVIHYAAGAESAAQNAGAVAEKWRITLANRLKFEPQGTIPIYLYPDRRSFLKATGIEPGDSVVGVAHTRTLRVRIDASGLYADVDHIVPHELVHVFVSQRLRGYAVNLPVWMQEGLAKYLAEDWTRADEELLVDAASGGELLPLAQISAVFPSDRQKRSIAYVESYSVVSFMVERYSSQSIPDLLTELETGRPFNQALFYSNGVTPEKLEEEWRRFIFEKYNLNRWIKFASGLISAAMAIAAILAFRAMMIRKRRVAEEYDENR